MGIAGMAGCCMLLVGAFGMLDTMKNFIDTQFEKLYNFDYKLTLKSEYTEDVLDKITAEYGNNTRQKKQREKIKQSIDITLKKSYYNNMLILKQ